ncbi:hypothetical protein ZIOFF_004035 [Zingiber officinale]|uniref:NB-ARC domain-containing protein n=1 Tax=Zingiber officinale TaxID=94328 RepID=A0A8J5IUT8_ZINOF|nr:hypothetical protein ZIOFF_004035 [Zingiber officinale]
MAKMEVHKTVEGKEDTWLLDSGCTHHMTPNGSLFDIVHSCNCLRVRMGDGKLVRVQGKGNIEVPTLSGTKTKFTTLYVLDLHQGLISIGQLLEEDYDVHFFDKKCEIRDAQKNLIVVVKMVDRSFPINWGEVLANAVSTDERELWHKRLGHCNYQSLASLSRRELVKDIRRDKLDSRADICIFVGYSLHSKGYRLYNIESQKIIVARDIKVDEHSIWNWEDKKIIHAVTPVLNVMHDEDDEEVNQSELILEEDKDDILIRGTRSLSDIYERCNAAIEEPSCFEEAYDIPEWEQAMKQELEMIEKNGTWGLVDRPSNRKAIGVKWIYKLNSLASEVGQLKDKSSDVKRGVEAATRDGMTPRSEVLGWLSSVQDMEGEAESIERKYNQKIKCLCSFPLNICSACRLRNRAEAALATIRELKQSAEFTKLADNLNLTRSIKMPTTKTIGMDKVFEELQRHAKDDSLSVIGIHGMGGVGKTALLRRFNNDFPSETEADVVIFLELSIDYKLEEVQKSLFDRLSLTWQDEVTHRDRATKLFRVLSTLKFILLLDNLWEPLNYQVVGIPLPAPPSKCKIIFTTRTEDTCSHMGTEKMIKMECLEEEAAWNLFRNSARMDVIDADKNVRIEARDLVKECSGLPAALIVLAQAMAPKKTWEEWMHALTIMKDTPHQLPASLTVRVHDDYFTMHPMTRAMILWVQRECGKKENKWLVRDRERVEEAPAAEKWRDAERIALVWNQISDLPEAPQCPNLIFLNLQFNKFLRKIPNGFFLHMPLLRILDLQQTSIEELPVSIGNLVQLHFLELSRTRITSLPKEMAALVNLKYLSLAFMKYLRIIPDQLISSLRELQWLIMMDSYSGWKEGQSC